MNVRRGEEKVGVVGEELMSRGGQDEAVSGRR